MTSSLPTEAILLVGGRGTRLSQVITDRPKPLALVAGKPFAEWLLLQLRAQGVRRFILASGHLSEHIQAHFGDGSRWGVDVVHSVETQPLGTGGAARLAAEHVQGAHCFVLNGDSYCAVDLAALARYHQRVQARATLALRHLPDGGRYGAVELAPDGQIRRFREKDPQAGPGLINAGVYCFARPALLSLPANQTLSIETDVFAAWADAGLYGVPGEGAFLDIGTPATYAQAENYLSHELARLEQPRPPFDAAQHILAYLAASNALKSQVAAECAEAIVTAAAVIAHALDSGHKLLICGNGGSAADAQHVAAELVSVLTQKFLRPGLPALALTTDTSMLSAYGNDFGFEGVFARQVQALGQPGDVLLGITTSGNSKNVVRAVREANARGLHTIGLQGAGGQLRTLAMHNIIIPSAHTQHVQEAMLAVEHLLCELVEARLFGRPLTA